MNNENANFNRVLSEFADLCDEHNIWYSLDALSLLASVRRGKSFDNSPKPQVMMTIDSYNKMKRIVKNRLVDSSMNSEIKSLHAYFVEDIKDVESYQPFVEIRLIIPTTVKKLKKFKSPIYKLANLLKRRIITTKTAINDLNDSKFEGFYLLGDRNDKAISSWVQVMSFETVDFEFEDRQYKVFREFDRTLPVWYGEDYLTKEMLIPFINFYSPIKQVREKI